MRAAGLAAVAALTAAGLAGCVDTVDQYYAFDPDEHYRNPGVFPGSYLFAQDGSRVLAPGPYQPGLPEVIRIRSDLPAYPTPGEQSLSDGEVLISMAVWRPQNVTGPVPIVVDAGPYYEQGEHCPVVTNGDCPVPMEEDTIDWPGQRTPFLLRNILPHGYAVAQVAVRGTGTSGGCMDLMGPAEQNDLVLAIEHLAQQPWSNGNVAMIGASYDGSTPWLVAASGTPHLKTIVPVSGLPSMHDLMFRNGSAETRGPIMHSLLVYWGYGFDDEFPSGDLWAALEEQAGPLPRLGSANGREQYQDLHNLVCPEVVEGHAMGMHAMATGEDGAALSSYWTERDYRQRVLDNYAGSVFLVHGLQDWNVDPHAAIPFNEALRQKGLEMKQWYGQWGHAFPDSQCAKQPAPDWAVMPCRLDFAEVLLRWFERHLKDNATVEVGAPVHVQDNLGFWRLDDAWPPADTTWQTWHLGAEAITPDAAGAETAILLRPGDIGPTLPVAGTVVPGPGNILRLSTPPLDEDLHIAGLPQVKLPFEVLGSGGEIAVWLFDEDPRGMVRSVGAVNFDGDWFPNPFTPPLVAHQQMDLRYHAGGTAPDILVPGERYIAQIELEPAEIHIPAGNRLTMWLFQYHYPDHSGTATPAPIQVFLGGADAQLRLPVLELDPRMVFPVPGAHFPNRTYMPEMYVPTPVLPDLLDGIPPFAPAAPSYAAASQAPLPAPPARPAGAGPLVTP